MKKFLKKIIPDFVFQIYHWKLALLGALIYGFPSKKIKVIGITGTNGKSTVVYLTSRLLEKAGYKIASISSVEFKIGDKIWPNDLKMTMPGRFKIQKFIREAVNQGCDYLILETTSEGIKQYRHKFINYQTAVLTNLTLEHIESHGSFENYKKTKGELFKIAKKIIVNADDENADYFLDLGEEKLIYSLKDVKNIQLTRNGAEFLFNNINFKTNLLGEFNIYNALASITICLSENISLDKINFENIRNIPGRLEIIIKEPFTVIVDYAHTPDALEKVYQTAKLFNHRIIGVLGSAGGGRDKWKRQEMGKIADKYCDEIIITNEDPYDEDPQKIIDEVANGIKNKTAIKIIDRQKAIQKALQSAEQGDIVIITGKGCEPWMCVAGGKKISWDDRKIVREEFEKL
ncbi:Mur ligase family protein [Patescibacteria group bacterium]